MRSFPSRCSIMIGAVIVLIILGCVTVPVKTSLLETDTGKVGFESIVIDENTFLRERKQGSPVTISGELTIPAGQGRMPAVILTHGSGGVGETERGWVKELNRMGLATFLVDSFSGRNISETATGSGGRLSTGSSVIDVYRALELLRTHPRIDPERICLMGFSRGGRVVLWAAMKRFQDQWLQPGRSFAAYLSFYPAMHIELQRQAEIADRPLRVFQGTADDWTIADKARDYVASLRKQGRDVQILEYAGAHHAFDNPKHHTALYLSSAVNLKKCSFWETPLGRILDKDTGEGSNSSCISRGATVAYNAKAHRQAIKDVEGFLRSTVGSS